MTTNYKSYSENFSSITPNLWSSEGQHPAEFQKPAPYLPLVRYDKKMDEWKVISSGKVLTTDVNGYMVPAGLLLDIELAIAETTFANCVNKYTATDVTEGVKNFAGATVTLNEPVVASFFTGGFLSGSVDNTKAVANLLVNPLGVPTGMSLMDLWREDGSGYGVSGGAGNVGSLRNTNYSLQQGGTLRTQYFIELPVLASGLPTLGGQTVFVGAPKRGDLVTFDANSNFVVYSALADATAVTVDIATFAAGTDGAPTNTELNNAFLDVETKVNTALASIVTKINTVTTKLNKIQGRILGRVINIDTVWPKDYLEWVRTYVPYNTTVTALEKPSGSLTDGLPSNLYHAGATDPTTAKLVKINVSII